MADTKGDTNELKSTLEQAILLLNRHGERHWSSKLEEALNLIKQRDVHGLDLLRSMYGGMGSINDLYLHSINGHRIRDKEVDRANEAVRRFLSRAYELMSELFRTA